MYFNIKKIKNQDYINTKIQKQKREKLKQLTQNLAST